MAKNEFTAGDFDPAVSFQERMELVKFYDSKTNSSLLRLVTIVIAIIGFNYGDLMGVFGEPSYHITLILSAFMLAGLFTATFYFLGRALYWSFISSALSSVRSYSQSYIETKYPTWSGETAKYIFSPMTGLFIAAKDECNNSPSFLRRAIFKIFNQYNRMLICLIFFTFTLLKILLIQSLFLKLYCT